MKDALNITNRLCYEISRQIATSLMRNLRECNNLTKTLHNRIILLIFLVKLQQVQWGICVNAIIRQKNHTLKIILWFQSYGWQLQKMI